MITLADGHLYVNVQRQGAHTEEGFLLPGVGF